MISLLKGRRGIGKTLALVYLGNKYKGFGWRVISNFKVSYAEFWTTKKIIEEITNLKNCFLMLDEAQLFFDSRNWKDTKNKDFGYFIAQIRKRKVHIGMTVQYVDNIEKRIRQHIDYVGEPKIFNTKKYGRVCRINWTDLTLLEDKKIVKPTFKEVFSCIPFEAMYNTYEVAE